MGTTLRTRWRQWTAIVELFARRRPARRRVEPGSYDALRGELIAACRALAASGDDSERALSEQLEPLVQPFLTPRVLEQTNREVLFDLLVRCQEAGRVLRGRARTRAGGRRVAPVIVTSLFGLIACLSVGHTWRSWMPLWHQMQAWSDVAWVEIKRSNDKQWMVIFVAVVILTSLALLARPART